MKCIDVPQTQRSLPLSLPPPVLPLYIENKKQKWEYLHPQKRLLKAFSEKVPYFSPLTTPVENILYL